MPSLPRTLQEKNILKNLLTYDKAYDIIKTMTEKGILAKIEQHMEKNNLRQWELAKKIGIPEATLSRWLRGKTNISNAYVNILKNEGVI